MNLHSRWRFSAEQHTTGNSPNGELVLTTNNEAYDLTLGLPDIAKPLIGVGFLHEGGFFVARGIVNGTAQLGSSVGLVRYALDNLGQLPAYWYHPSLNGKLSKGESSNGPKESLVGEYCADYQSADGIAFDPLRKTITKVGSHFHFSWWSSERFHYVGVGQIVNNSLYAAWGPPGSIIQFVHYDSNITGDTIRGEWFDYGRNKCGTELLHRI